MTIPLTAIFCFFLGVIVTVFVIDVLVRTIMKDQKSRSSFFQVLSKTRPYEWSLYCQLCAARKEQVSRYLDDCARPPPEDFPCYSQTFDQESCS